MTQSVKEVRDRLSLTVAKLHEVENQLIAAETTASGLRSHLSICSDDPNASICIERLRELVTRLQAILYGELQRTIEELKYLEERLGNS